MLLYWGSGSPPCWRAMIVLEEKGLQGYESKMVSFEKKEHKGEDVLKLNPRGQVPTFKHGDTVVNESLAICQYLESAFAGQGTRLYPEDGAKLAQVLQKQFEVLNLAEKGSSLVYYIFRTKKEDQSEEEIKTRSAALSEEVQRWEDGMTEGGYVAGADFSMADVLFYPQIAFLVRMGAPLTTKYPKLAAYYDLVTKRPSVQASWPPHWKESEGKDTLKDL